MSLNFSISFATGFHNLQKSEDNFWLFENELISFCAHQGLRDQMEDRMHSICDPITNLSIFSVFDGHGGDSVADYLESNYSSHVSTNILKNVAATDNENNFETTKKKITGCIHEIDRDIIKKDTSRIYTGSTLCSAVIQNNKYLTVANVGDSRAIASDSQGNCVVLTKDHKPSDAKEKQRIKEAGGVVTQEGEDCERVQGILAMTRSIGDASLKARKFLIVDPDVKTYDLTKEKFRYIIIASDGLFDVFEDEEIIQKANLYLKTNENQLFPKLAWFSCKDAIKHGTEDNVSILIIKLFL
uniref:PPM-type phosphatase domain-containing protein n=1 Tax=Panagrolaimus sp. PS1159 TaxID=55785 RepID=A0AC35GP85_9BILA